MSTGNLGTGHLQPVLFVTIRIRRWRAITRIGGSGTAIFDHQYMGLMIMGLVIAPHEQHRRPSGNKRRSGTGPAYRSHSYRRSTGAPYGASTRAANSGEQVNGQWAIVPMFHSTPPLNQALRIARLAG
jgi:hypothetical protein